MKGFKAILFDYDDTLVDSFQARIDAAKRAVEGVLDPRVDIERIMREWAGRPQMEIWQDLVGDVRKAEAMMDEYRRWYWRESPKIVRLFPGARAMLDEIKAMGLALGIVTSKARMMQGEDGPYGAVVEMERLGLDGVFDVVVGWEDVQESKPAPGPILFALKKLGLHAGDALMVGDSHNDVKAAKMAGVSSAGVGWGTRDRGLLVQAGPDYMVESPTELTSLLS